MKKYLYITLLLGFGQLINGQSTYTYDNLGNRTQRTTILSPLPLNLLTFEGSRFGHSIILDWRTTNEEKFSHFEIEKSQNTSEFGVIGKVFGSSEIKGFYNFTDINPKVGSVNYYRLRMIDTDGKTTFSKIISVQFDAATAYLLVENPVSDNEILVSTNTPNPNFTLTNSIGNKISISVINLGQEKYKIKSSASLIGIYILSLQADKKIIYRKLLLQ